MILSQLNILYIGDIKLGTTSLHRCSAMSRLGHHVTYWDPTDHISKKLSNSLFTKIDSCSGHLFAEKIIRNSLVRFLAKRDEKFDVIWINSGEYISPNTVCFLKSKGSKVILYNNDDPTGNRDGNRFLQVRRSIPYYDLIVTVRIPTFEEIIQYRAKKTLRVFMSYDEIVHRPLEKDEILSDFFLSDITFIGTWMRNEGRDTFIRSLLNEGLKIKIWGSRWDKSPDNELVRHCWQGKPLSDRDYVRAICGAKLCLGFLSKGNRDEHTRRSVEIPYAGGILCAERTREHLELYREGEEAVFWSNPGECAARCKELLADPVKRESIRVAGMKRVRENKLGNEDIVDQILRKALSI